MDIVYEYFNLQTFACTTQRIWIPIPKIEIKKLLFQLDKEGDIGFRSEHQSYYNSLTTNSFLDKRIDAHLHTTKKCPLNCLICLRYCSVFRVVLLNLLQKFQDKTHHFIRSNLSMRFKAAFLRRKYRDILIKKIQCCCFSVKAWKFIKLCMLRKLLAELIHWYILNCMFLISISEKITFDSVFTCKEISTIQYIDKNFSKSFSSMHNTLQLISSEKYYIKRFFFVQMTETANSQVKINKIKKMLKRHIILSKYFCRLHIPEEEKNGKKPKSPEKSV